MQVMHSQSLLQEVNMVSKQQLRLLQLRHASKCKYERKCPNFDNCTEMKELWKHILNCKHNDCKTDHCLSSRHVLCHYSKCKAGDCKICVPVRVVIYKKKLVQQQQQYNFQKISPPPQHHVSVSIQQTVSTITSDSKSIVADEIFDKTVSLNMVATNITAFSVRDRDRTPPRKIKRIEPSKEVAVKLKSNSKVDDSRAKPKIGCNLVKRDTDILKQRCMKANQSLKGQDLCGGMIDSSRLLAPSTTLEHMSSSASQKALLIAIKSIYPLDPISCGIYSFSNEEIKAHISDIQESLRLTPAKIKAICNQVIQKSRSQVDESCINLGEN